MGAPPTEVCILSLNCWGIPYVSGEYKGRLAEIGRQIVDAEPTPHIVCLQECFARKDFDQISREVRSILPHTKHYHAGPFGAGLSILSRWPIEETSMFRYPLNGYPTAFYHGDWYVGKGVARATVRYGEAADNVIEVFNTHMHAYYASKSEYLCHRVGQAWEFAKLLHAASRNCHGRALVLGLGDFNAEPDSFPMRVLHHRAPDMHDTWVEGLHVRRTATERSQQSGVNTSVASAVGIEEGATYGSPYNTWHCTRDQRARRLNPQTDSPTDQRALPSELEYSAAARLDYVLANVASRTNASLARNEDGDVGVWAVTSAKLGMLGRHPSLGCSLSDHFGVQVTLTLGQGGKSSRTPDKRSGPVVVNDADEEGVLDEVLRVIKDYKLQRARRARWRNVRLGLAMAVFAGSLAGAWSLDEFGWARFLLGIAGATALSLGILDGCGGFLFHLAEGAALKEFEWEVENARNAGTGNSGRRRLGGSIIS